MSILPFPRDHNGGPSLDSIVEENLRVGLHLAQRDVLIRANRDPRINQRHRLVLCEIIMSMNDLLGLSFPGREYLARVCQYPESTISTVIYDLVRWGYISSGKKSAEEGKKAQACYTVIRPTREELEAEISAFVNSVREQKSSPSRTLWLQKRVAKTTQNRADFKCRVEVRPPDFKCRVELKVSFSKS